MGYQQQQAYSQGNGAMGCEYHTPLRRQSGMQAHLEACPHCTSTACLCTRNSRSSALPSPHALRFSTHRHCEVPPALAAATRQDQGGGGVVRTTCKAVHTSCSHAKGMHASQSIYQALNQPTWPALDRSHQGCEWPTVCGCTPFLSPAASSRCALTSADLVA